MNRRQFILSSVASLATAGSMGCYQNQRRSISFPGEILGASQSIGHLLRERNFPKPSRERRVPVVIVGGGASGLSAAWKLNKAGFKEFEVLELEAECGGNSRFGENRITAYPWGAHYVPIPTQESKAVRELFAELGIIEGYTSSGKPIYQERFLCFAPQERLFIHGCWQEGLLPLTGATKKDLEQYDRFRDLILRYRHQRGKDGRKAFAIPMELSSRDKGLMELDRISLRDFLLSRGFDSVPLHWYANYACRDDYGTDYNEVSAWAGIHYFASRDGGDEGMEDSTVLTWPEGNGWIVKRLRDLLAAHIITDALVFRLVPQRDSVLVDVFHPKENISSRIAARAVIYACPRHFGRYLLEDTSPRPDEWLKEFQHAPWMVANLSLRSLPIERVGSPLSWDNVIYDSPSLGYVVATHQSLRTYVPESVFTYYYPLTGTPVSKERNHLLETNWRAWAEVVLNDLSKPHPEIERLVTRLDIFRWGHAMVRPRPGFVWGDARRQAAKPVGNIHFAHSDLSGFSIFEEAQYRGVLAAERVLSQFRIPHTTSL